MGKIKLKSMIKFLGVVLIFLGILLNQYFLMWFLPIPYISFFKSLLLLFYNIVAVIVGIFLIVKAKKISLFILKRKYELLLLTGSIIFTLVILEFMLRFCIFNPGCDIILVKSASYYANSDDTDYWYYKYIFADSPDIKYNSSDTNRFYSGWALSLKPDPLLGHARKKNVKLPCHETTNLGTRGIRKYSYKGKKIIFYGDSFTESNACSNDTITTKIEKKTRIESLNYGVGGYGFDQTFLLFNKTYNMFDMSKNVYLIGLIHSDLDRLIAKGQTTNKPYFTVENNKLQLHIEHIYEESLTAYFDNYKPKPRIYIINLILGKIGIREVWNGYLNKKNTKAKKVITSLILKEIKNIQEENNLNLYIVVFYPKHLYTGYRDWKIEFLESQLKEYDLEYIDLKECLLKYQQKNEISIVDLYDSGHPIPEANNVLADCIIEDINLAKI